MQRFEKQLIAKVATGAVLPLPILFSLYAPAAAADLLETLKASLNDAPPLTWGGVTLYGNIDIGGQYESNGARQTPGAYNPPTMLAPRNQGPVWQVAPDQSSISMLGLRFDQPLPFDTKFVGQLETGFNPVTGDIDNFNGTIKMFNGIPLAQQTFSGDGARAGQLFNGLAYGGFSHPLYGTLTVGRQYSAAVDAFAEYDPLFSLGFSLLSFYGATDGLGGQEAAYVNQSVKYRNKLGPFNAEFIYSAAGDSFKDTLQGKVGFDYEGFSAAVIGGHLNDALSIASLGGAANLGSNFVGAKVSDTTTWGVFAKYKFNVGSSIPVEPSEKDRALKTKAPPAMFTPSLTISGGYENIRYSNPADGGWGVGHTTIGGNQIGPVVTTTGLASMGIVDNGFTGGDQIMQVPFVGARYTWDPQWTAAVMWYQKRTNSFGFGVQNPAVYSPVACSNASFSNCAGYEEVESFRADYAFTKNITFYGGMTYSSLHGGAQFGFLSKDELSETIGVRYQF